MPKVLPQDEITFHEEHEGITIVGKATGKDLFEDNPEWNGDIEIGHLVPTDLGMRQITAVKIHYPNEGEIVTKYDITFSKYPR